MPLGRHRIALRFYDDSFTGQEAIEFMLDFLRGSDSPLSDKRKAQRYGVLIDWLIELQWKRTCPTGTIHRSWHLYCGRWQKGSVWYRLALQVCYWLIISQSIQTPTSLSIQTTADAYRLAEGARRQAYDVYEGWLIDWLINKSIGEHGRPSISLPSQQHATTAAKRISVQRIYGKTNENDQREPRAVLHRFTQIEQVEIVLWRGRIDITQSID